MKWAIALVIGLMLFSGCVYSSSYYTPDYVNQNKEGLVGQRVSVIGTIDTGILACTLMACSQENPCCNICSGSPSLKGSQDQIFLQGSVSCSGNNCEQTCEPMEKGKQYIVTGIWSEEFGEYYLNVEGFKAV